MPSRPIERMSHQIDKNIYLTIFNQIRNIRLIFVFGVNKVLKRCLLIVAGRQIVGWSNRYPCDFKMRTIMMLEQTSRKMCNRVSTKIRRKISNADAIMQICSPSQIGRCAGSSFI